MRLPAPIITGGAMCELLRAIEWAAVRGWPALQTAEHDGWIWRHTSGGSIRANSVAALAYTGKELGASIDHIAALYRGRGAPACFTISDVSAPAGLDAELEIRGWRRGSDHVTMAKPVTRRHRQDFGVEVAARPSGEWMAVYLSGLSPDRRDIAPRLLAGLPKETVFLGARRGGRVIASGASIIDGRLASVQCMATLSDARRQGGASAVLGVIERLAAGGGATHLYLQTEGANAAARGLYEHAGFAVVGRYHTRTKDV
jgi:ribosomal protein S18 acetylase RimI-like enzyme